MIGLGGKDTVNTNGDAVAHTASIWVNVVFTQTGALWH